MEDKYRKNGLKSEEMQKDIPQKKKHAIALSYEAGEKAPKVVASGQGILAEKIISEAEKAAVPVHKDEKLANTLSKLEIGDMIPPELYEVVAEILVFVDDMERLKQKILYKKTEK